MIITLVSIIITIACLSVIMMIIKKRWNALGAIDLESLPSERDAKTKKKIVTDRLRRHYHQTKAQIKTKAAPFLMVAWDRLGNGCLTVGRMIRDFVSTRMHPNQSEHEEVPVSQSSIDKSLVTAQKLIDDDQFDAAEKRYIDIISKDAKNIEAYEGLSDIYIQKKEWASAQEVLEFLCAQLRDRAKKEVADASARGMHEVHLATILMELSQVYRMLEKNTEAVQCLQDAVALQPQNPKFLDAELEMYIILGKKREARAALSRFRAANPENKKLEEFETRIESL